ncbi:hypothetical protein NDU88_005913 [Pleurodeles waltl]|uniref:Uncharacterized protein n=1 Tax=Pleurodeles waltl TaxID=8319 RepID=A0AAV7VPM2_PLEWA|nr:hypothetical protein NDU88_005913 [Pleurodeles waltl]
MSSRPVSQTPQLSHRLYINRSTGFVQPQLTQKRSLPLERVRFHLSAEPLWLLALMHNLYAASEGRQVVSNERKYSDSFEALQDSPYNLRQMDLPSTQKREVSPLLQMDTYKSDLLTSINTTLTATINALTRQSDKLEMQLYLILTLAKSINELEVKFTALELRGLGIGTKASSFVTPACACTPIVDKRLSLPEVLHYHYHRVENSRAKLRLCQATSV